MNALMQDVQLPLCVDLDGTLVATDTLFELLLVAIKFKPWVVLLLPIWLLGGRARFKQRLVEKVSLSPSSLPYRADVLEYLIETRARGRKLFLVTAANEAVGRGVAQHLGLFDGVMGSTALHNLKGTGKAAKLVEEFGRGGFDYIGDSRADLVVWEAARKALVVGSNTFAKNAAKVAKIERVFPTRSAGVRDWLKALRVYQWVKNLLVFVPLLAAHMVTDAVLFGQAVIAFIAFGLCASSVYVINDLFDLESDREHARKASRPFAAGRISLLSGMAAALILLLAAAIVARMLPISFVLVLALYFVVTLAYSLRLKRTTVLDVLLLAGLYTIRIIAGAAAVGLEASFWLLAFSMFLFLSLALVKRVTELHALPEVVSDKPAGRAYARDDLPVLTSLGTASAYTCVLVLALYINSGQSVALYKHAEALWLMCPILLFWLSRVWLVTHRGQMHDDPIVFAFRDSISRWLVLPAVIVMWLAT